MKYSFKYLNSFLINLVILVNINTIIAQSNIPLYTTLLPTASSFPNNTKINKVEIYEQYTLVELSITNWVNNQSMRFKSNSYIISYNDTPINYNTYNIIKFENNDLDKTYTWGVKGKTNIFKLYFTKIPPGIKMVNIIINPNETDQYNWLGVTIINPDTHPKTDYTEQSIKEAYKISGTDEIEGIYEDAYSQHGIPKYKLALKRNLDRYELIYLSGVNSNVWKEGDIKAVLTETATPLLFKVKWYLFNKTSNDNFYISFEQGSMKIITTDASNPSSFYIKLFPPFSLNNSSKNNRTSGSGFAISSNGFIATNFHVIEGLKDIKIRGVNNEFDETFKAKVVIFDKNNDLAILQIDDPLFTSLGNIPYVISSNICSTGEDVFVLGYPLRATMGNEIKLTNGVISSKSGFQGDVTSYQISAPVQPGNSGGPMFDKNGNIIGIINAMHSEAQNASYAVKSIYLKNLIDLLENKIVLQKINLLTNKQLTDQVKIVQKYIYIVEGN